MKRAPHWAEIGEATSVFGIAFMYWLYRVFGRWPFRACLYPVVLYYWMRHRVARESSLQYLQRLEASTHALGRPPRLRHTFQHVLLFADTMLDKVLATAGRYPMERVRFEGRDAMLAQLSGKRGGILLTAHIGCLELCQVMARFNLGFRINALIHTAHAERYNRIIRRLDPDARVTLIQVTDISPATAMMLAQKIDAGEFVAIAGDRVPVRGGRVAMADFLGHPAPFPIGPYVLASVLDCPVYTMACTHGGDGYVVRFEPFAERIVLPRRDRAPELATQAASFASWLQTRLREAPYDWFNFYPFWDQAADDARSP